MNIITAIYKTRVTSFWLLTVFNLAPFILFFGFLKGRVNVLAHNFVVGLLGYIVIFSGFYFLMKTVTYLLKR